MILVKGKSTEEIYDLLDLEEHTLYEVEVQFFESNPEHQAFLFFGFKSGGYCTVYTTGHEYPSELKELYSIKIIKELTKID